MDFYTILGVSKGASQEEIRKQYKKKAVLLHPDKQTGNDEKFKELAEAYSVLSDEKKRQDYDMFGKDYDKVPQTNDVFNMFNFMHQHHSYNQTRNNIPKINKDIEVEVEVSLEDIYNGVVKSISFYKNEKCNKCVDNKIISCNTCNGLGKIMQIRQIGPFIHRSEHICEDCSGNGKNKYKNINCIICKGANVISMRKTVQIKIPKGVMPNHKIMINKEGHQDINDIYGNLIVNFKEITHKTFIRNKNNLLLKKDISLYDILFRQKQEIIHLDNRKIFFDLDNENEYDIICIPNEGMYIFNDNIQNENKRGDLYVIFNIIYPKKSIPKNIQINANNNIINMTNNNNDVSINNMELFILLLEQKNNIKNIKQNLTATKKITTKTKNYIKMLLIKKTEDVNTFNDDIDDLDDY
jgi:DnaJ-class molecular chaperone